MNETHTAIVSAFLDHEPVDPEALSAALDDPDARAALVDFVRLRQDLGLASDALPASLQTLRRQPVVRTVALRWSAAAALLALVFLAGWMAPRSAGDATGVTGPPDPVRVETFTPGVDWSFR
jgi:ferric-dicitrate binding protein FerR (iron transport regulator)